VTGFVELILALIGLALLVLLALAALSDGRSSALESPQDPAAPYREGLQAATRMQKVARDLEQQIYAEAAKHMGREPDSDGPSS
jgi:hypothetical protein